MPILTTLLAGVATSTRWWQLAPSPPAPAGLPCPGGATFKLAQTWPSGFRAFVQIGSWVEGRRVRLHFSGEGDMPDLSRPVGATQLDSVGHSALFSLNRLPGHLAQNSFDLQARTPAPPAESVVVTCDLPYPPPPPSPSAPPLPPQSCVGAEMSVGDAWDGGYGACVHTPRRDSAARFAARFAALTTCLNPRAAQSSAYGWAPAPSPPPPRSYSTSTLTTKHSPRSSRRRVPARVAWLDCTGRVSGYPLHRSTCSWW